MTKKNAPTDIRAERKRFERNLMWLVVFGFLVIGGGLIFLIYGVGGLIGALPFLLCGIGIMGMLIGFFALSEWLTNRFDA